jgi:hypothetical protein
MKTSRSFFTGLWTKMTTTPGMATSFLPRKKIPRLFLWTVIQQREDTSAADRRLQRTTKTPETTPVVVVMMATTAAALATAMATTTPVFPLV